MTINATKKREENEQKRQMRRKLVSMISLFLLIVLLVIIYLNFAFGWFTYLKYAHANDAQISVSNVDFELAVSGDQVTPYANDAPIVGYLDVNEGIEKAASTDADNHINAILCNFINENPYEEGLNDLAPGSYGRMSFDIVVKDDYTGDFRITLDTVALDASGSTPQAIDPADEATLYSLLSGHILIFENRANRTNGGYYYTDRITDEGFIFETSAHTPTVLSDGKHYTVNIYWIWPSTFAQFALAENNPKLHANSVFHNESLRQVCLTI